MQGTSARAFYRIIFGVLRFQQVEYVMYCAFDQINITVHITITGTSWNLQFAYFIARNNKRTTQFTTTVLQNNSQHLLMYNHLELISEVKSFITMTPHQTMSYEAIKMRRNLSNFSQTDPFLSISTNVWFTHNVNDSPRQQ